MTDTSNTDEYPDENYYPGNKPISAFAQILNKSDEELASIFNIMGLAAVEQLQSSVTKKITKARQDIAHYANMTDAVGHYRRSTDLTKTKLYKLFQRKEYDAIAYLDQLKTLEQQILNYLNQS